MKSNIAKSVIEMVNEISGLLNTSLFDVKEKEHQEIFNAYGDAISEILQLHLEKLVNPLFRQHPHLMPESFFLPNSYLNKKDDSGL